MINWEDKQMSDNHNKDEAIYANENEGEGYSNRPNGNSAESKFASEVHFLKKKIKRIELLNYISIIMITALLVFSFMSGFKASSTNQINDIKELPKSLNKAVANEIINEIKENYNNRDSKELYNLMGEYMKTMLTLEEFDKSLSQLEILGNLNNASYTHYDFLEHRDGADWFVLNYIAKYENGDGKATVSIRAVGDEYEIVGFRFNVDQLKQ
jgi:hypothetical protein